MTGITTIIFDLDGTLLDTLEDLADGVNYALAQYGYPVRTMEEVRRFVGNGVSNLIECSIQGPAAEGAFSMDRSAAAGLIQECGPAMKINT